MTTRGATTLDWSTANQHHLMAAVGRVRGALERHAAMGARADGSSPSGDAMEASTPDAATQGSLPHAPHMPYALDAVCAGFGLSSFERDVLVLCAAVELEGAFAGLCAAAQGDPSAPFPTFGLALAALPDPHWSALLPTGPLRHTRLVEVGQGPGITSSPLRIEERVLHFLTGLEHLDERLEGLIHPLDPAQELPPSQRRTVDGVVTLWSSQARSNLPPSPVQICGPDHSANRAVAAETVRQVGLRAFVLAAESIPSSAHEIEALARLWTRESVLGGGALVVDGHGDTSEAIQGAIARLVEWTARPTIVAARDPIRTMDRLAVRFDVERPGTDERRDRWTLELGELAESLNGELEQVAGQFELGSDQIRAACDRLRATPLEQADDAGGVLWDACRVQARPRLDDLAQRIEPAASWQDLVLPPAQGAALKEMAAHCRHRTRVYEVWGFGSKGLRGLGISALFAGASGTGKTMAAEVLAGDLRLDLYRIDLSSVVSKYIGETEKNLRRVFDAAEEGGAILLFDEADALFGKRSEVRDSHDRYANIEVSYLLQRMEAYRGLAILTTNLKGALDPAFLRRIRFVIQFPFPGPAERAEIWRRIFPAETPTDGLDHQSLARLNVAGGSIRNIAVGAAFLAAEAGGPVGMEHILRAARTEYAKLEKPLTSGEIGGWA